MFDEETWRSTIPAQPASFEFTERPTDLIVQDGEIRDMAPRRPHDPTDLIRGWGFSMSADAAVRLLTEVKSIVRMVGMSGVVMTVLIIGGIVSAARYGDPAANVWIDRQRTDNEKEKVGIEKDRAMAAALKQLVDKDVIRESRDQIILDRFSSILEEMRKANQR